jgi:hypothetical protein
MQIYCARPKVWPSHTKKFNLKSKQIIMDKLSTYGQKLSGLCLKNLLHFFMLLDEKRVVWYLYSAWNSKTDQVVLPKEIAQQRYFLLLKRQNHKNEVWLIVNMLNNVKGFTFIKNWKTIIR